MIDEIMQGYIKFLADGTSYFGKRVDFEEYIVNKNVGFVILHMKIGGKEFNFKIYGDYNDLADKVIKQLFLNFFNGVYTTEEEREKLLKLGSAYLNEMAM